MGSMKIDSDLHLDQDSLVDQMLGDGENVFFPLIPLLRQFFRRRGLEPSAHHGILHFFNQSLFVLRGDLMLRQPQLILLQYDAIRFEKSMNEDLEEFDVRCAWNT